MQKIILGLVLLVQSSFLKAEMHIEAYRQVPTGSFADKEVTLSWQHLGTGKEEIGNEILIWKGLCNLRTFDSGGLVHPLTGEIVYIFILEDGKQIGRAIRIGWPSDGGIYLVAGITRRAQGDVVTAGTVEYFPIYSEEFAQFISNRLKEIKDRRGTN